MSTLKESIGIRVPPDQLFTHVAGLWESGTGLGGPAPEGVPSPSARMGEGFSLRCPGRVWAIPADIDLEVEGYVESGGWRAVSRPESALSWTVRIEPREGGSELTCLLRQTPRGLVARVEEWLVHRRSRRRALRRLLRGWKQSVERQEALRRLRASLEAPEPGRPRDAG